MIKIRQIGGRRLSGGVSDSDIGQLLSPRSGSLLRKLLESLKSDTTVPFLVWRSCMRFGSR